jgi:hypothetical protein
MSPRAAGRGADRAARAGIVWPALWYAIPAPSFRGSDAAGMISGTTIRKASHERSIRQKNSPLFKSATVIPVLTIERLEDAVPLAKALVAGGVRVLEVTLRTPVAIEAAKAMIARCRKPSSASAPS